MTEIIAKLQEDHRHPVQIFDLIDRELEAIEHGQEPNFDLLAHILDYIKYYPDVFHHPLEDFVFDCLGQRTELLPVVDQLQDDHLKLAELTKAFRDSVTHLEGGDNSALGDRVITLGRAYVEHQRRHMATEEDIVFPQALGVLTDEEWARFQEYAAAAAPEADPIFGPSVTARYQELKERLDQHL